MKNLQKKLYPHTCKVKVITYLLCLSLALNITNFNEYKKNSQGQSTLGLALSLDLSEISREDNPIKTIFAPDYLNHPEPDYIFLKNTIFIDEPNIQQSHIASKFQRWSKSTFT